MRINRFLAAAGCGSRRACEDLVLQGKVSINGRTVDSLGTQVAPNDVVKVGARVVKARLPVVLAMNKPKGVLTTCSDPGKRKTVLDLLPTQFGRLFPVGRLDKESEGLLILTNDGALAQRLQHPSHGVEKEYEVSLDRPFDAEHGRKLVQGFLIEGGFAKARQVHLLAKSKLKIVLEHGIKRQIRLMLFKFGYEVVKLRRVRIGGLRLGRLAAGGYEILDKRQTELLETRQEKLPGKAPSRGSRKANGPGFEKKPS